MPRCKICRQKFEIKYSTMQKTCLEASCVVAWYQKEKQRKEKKAWQERKVELERTSISLPQLKNKAKAVFQSAIRRRDKDKPCVSCGTYETKQWDAGHYMKAEVYSGVIFHEFNVNIQCVYCNRNLHGNEVAYRKSLVMDYGEQVVSDFEDMAKATRHKKWSRTELFEIIETYKNKWKDGI